jgi:hypothetical protein
MYGFYRLTAATAYSRPVNGKRVWCTTSVALSPRQPQIILKTTELNGILMLSYGSAG